MANVSWRLYDQLTVILLLLKIWMTHRWSDPGLRKHIADRHSCAKGAQAIRDRPEVMGTCSKQNSRSPYFTFRKYFSVLSHDWCISNLPNIYALPIPTSPFSSNTFRPTPALTLPLFIPMWHYLPVYYHNPQAHLAISQCKNRLRSCFCGQVMMEELAKRRTGWDRLNDPGALKYRGHMWPFKLHEL